MDSRINSFENLSCINSGYFVSQLFIALCLDHGKYLYKDLLYQRIPVVYFEVHFWEHILENLCHLLRSSVLSI